MKGSQFLTGQWIVSLQGTTGNDASPSPNGWPNVTVGCGHMRWHVLIISLHSKFSPRQVPKGSPGSAQHGCPSSPHGLQNRPRQVSGSESSQTSPSQQISPGPPHRQSPDTGLQRKPGSHSESSQQGSSSRPHSTQRSESSSQIRSADLHSSPHRQHGSPDLPQLPVVNSRCAD